jgi:hypothetical protein
VYDDLDRPASRIIGTRGLSAADRTLMVSGSETYVWDLGANHTGYLRHWNAFAPSAPTPDVHPEYFNDIQGIRGARSRSIT